MFKTFAHLMLALSVTLPTIGQAQSFVRQQHFRLPAVAQGPDTFEIIEADGAGGSQIWCGAGIYARHVLEQRGGDLYILRGRGDSLSRPGRKSVVFTTKPVEGAFTSVSAGVRRAGKTFSMSHAFALCSEMPFLRLRLEDGRIVRRGI